MAGGDFLSLHWRADESPEGLADSFGLLATFSYKDQLEEQARKYRERGVRAVLE